MIGSSLIQEQRLQTRGQASLNIHRNLDLGGEHFIGIDVGTASVRACVIDSTGDIKGLASEDIRLWQPQTGFYEQSTTNIWRSICISVQRALSQHSIDPSTVRGICFDATCSLAVFSHDTNEPIPVTPGFSDDGNDRNVILWLDHRPKSETKMINQKGHKLLRFVGGQMDEEMEMPKILWLKNHMPVHLFDRCKFYNLVDALTQIATGMQTWNRHEHVFERKHASVGVDGILKGWQKDFYESVGLEDLTKNNFKRVGGVDSNGCCPSAGDLIGGLSVKAGHELGLRPGTAVGSGVIDAYAGWVGTVAARVDLDIGLSKDYAGEGLALQACRRLATVAGTSTCHIAMSKKQIFVHGVWGPYQDVLIPDSSMAEGGQPATGELLKHVIETHPACSEALSKARLQGLNVYDYLNVHLEHMMEDLNAPSISYLARYLFFYGDLWGNRSPIADPEMVGSIIGLTNSTDLDSLAIYYYATMEFITMQMRQIIETMNQAGHSIASIFISGSQCQNKYLMFLMATISSMPVIVPEHAHAAVVHGAAMLAAKAASTDKAGESEELWSIMQRMSKPGTVVKPGKDRGEKILLELKYKVFLEQSIFQRVCRKSVDEAIRGWV